MSTLENLVDVTQATFDTVVVEGSHLMPVLVDYWADWCAPCKMQMPVLVKLAEELQGRFLVAKVNTDEQRELANAQGIRSLPTLRLYRNGEVVDEALGAQTESSLRAMIEPFLERESDKSLARAVALLEQGKPDEALAELRAGYESDPGNQHLALEYLAASIQYGKLDTARELLDGLPREVRETPQVAGLSTLLDFAELVADAPPAPELEDKLKAQPENRQTRYLLAARQTLAMDFDAAMENLLAVIQREPGFADGAAKRGLLGIFELLGGDDQRVAGYRRKLFMLLH